MREPRPFTCSRCGGSRWSANGARRLGSKRRGDVRPLEVGYVCLAPDCRATGWSRHRAVVADFERETGREAAEVEADLREIVRGGGLEA